MLIWYRQIDYVNYHFIIKSMGYKNITILDPFENISMTLLKYKFNKHVISPYANTYDCVHGPR